MVAATNARSNASGEYYDQEKSLLENLKLKSPLLSRFDLILVIIDRRDALVDQRIAAVILNSSMTALANENESQEQQNVVSKHDTLQWSFELLKNYFCLIKTLKPSFTHGAGQVLRKYYYYKRQTPSHDPSRCTIRMFESMIRFVNLST